MSMMVERIAKNQARVLVMLLLWSATSATPAVAKDKSSDASPQRVTVIGHLPLPGAPINQMFVQENGAKQYLYVQQGSEQQYTVIDVSKPNKPEIVKHEKFTAPNGKLQMVGGGLALAETPDSSSAGSARHELAPAKTSGSSSSRRPESIRVLDLSDPANPRTLQTFDGVTSVLADDPRSLIYIANGEGIWILSHKPARPPMPRCDSEAAFSPIADCQ